MSEARRERQRQEMADQAAAFLRSRDLMRPSPVAVAVRSALRGRLEHPACSLAVLQSLSAVGIWTNRGTFNNTRGRP